MAAAGWGALVHRHLPPWLQVGGYLPRTEGPAEVWGVGVACRHRLVTGANSMPIEVWGRDGMRCSVCDHGGVN